MSNSVFLLFFLSFVSSFYFIDTTFTTTSQCSDLLLFKQNLSSFNFSVWPRCEGYYPIMMNWNTSNTKDCCYWDGITCNHSTGDIIELDLSCGMLQGTLHPNTSLFNLPHLQILNLAFNDFSGSQIPPKIERFSNTLTHFNISHCGFSGKVPVETTLLNKLVSLDLSRNNYVDFSLEPRVFINLLQNLTCLEELSLEFVRISSSFPTHSNISYSLKLLNLQYTGFHGKLPHSLFNLQSLEKLDLSRNSFTGQIPWEISLLPKLVSLDLSLNNNLRIEPHIFNHLLQNSTLLRYLIFGDVNIGLVLPTYLNVSSSLKSLDLRNTSLKGKLSDNIFNFRYIELLDLSGNTNLIGELPEVNNTIPLKQLSLSNCGLTGSIPESIGNLRHLTLLDLSSNKLNGKLPLVFPQSLKQLFLDDNQFDGQIDVVTFEQLTNLTTIYLSHNNFSGEWELDTLLSNLTNLEILDLSYCGLFVTTSDANQTNHHVNSNLRFLYMASCKINVFPGSLRSMKNLRFLDVSSNEIHGQIPHWAGEIGGSKLLYFNISHNFITGLPQFQWYGLLALYLQSNLIQGPFHPSICNMRNLVNLDLSNNRFDGVIPQRFGNITSSLQMINLGRNHFQGTIPNVFENCGGLEGLILNENLFEGDVPISLSKCQSLKVLDMGNNHLNGTFPYWLESLPNLQVLVLKSNGFHGYIKPSSIVGLKFPILQVIDLSHNSFEGQIPRKYFKNFNAMKNGVKRSTTQKYVSAGGLLYSFIVTAKGVDQEFTQLYVYYTIVCLSHNNFVGEIPDIIGNLNSLVVVDLSHNSLTGQIPHTLGKLSQIESLDLSCNQLTGKY